MNLNLQPYAFDVGQSERGNVLKGLDLGVEGMRVGGQVCVSSCSFLLQEKMCNALSSSFVGIWIAKLLMIRVRRLYLLMLN